MYSDIPRWLSVSVYLYASYKLIKAQSLEKPLNNWLRLFIRAFAVFQFIWGCFMIPYIIPQYSNSLLDHVGWYPVFVPLVILIYWAGIRGYMLVKPETNLLRKGNKITDKISPETANQILDQLKNIMEQERLYLRPDLDLELLSRHVDIAPKNISMVLNNYLDQSFNQWINNYRVAAFKQRLLEADHAHLTLVGVAFECGFNSQASFQRIFKQVTGMVPSAYKDSCIE
jgi:AraC-like DNA-binding protein